MSVIRKLASQTAVYGLSSMARLISTLVLVPLQSRVLSEEQNGTLSFYYSLVAFAMVLLTYGMETAFFRFSSQRDDKQTVFNTAFRSICISTGLFLVLGILFGNDISSFLGFDGGGVYVKWLVLILAMDTLCAIPFARLRELNKAKRFALARILNIAVNLSLNVVFLWLLPQITDGKLLPSLATFAQSIYNPERQLEYVFMANAAGSLVSLLLLLPVIKTFSFKADKALLRKMLVYSWPLIIVGLAGMVNETLDRVLLKYLLPNDIALSQVGIYGTCYKLSIFLTIFVQAFRFAAEPFFFSQSSQADARLTYSKVMDWFVAVCSFIFLAICLYMDIARHFIDEKFWGGLHVVPVLLMANLCLGIYVNLSIWYKLSNNTKIGSYISVGGAMLTLVLLWWLIPIYGYTGAAWTTLVCYLSMAVAGYLGGQKYYPIPYRVAVNLGVILLALGIYVLSQNWEAEFGQFKLMIHSAMLILYALLVYFIALRKPANS